LSDKKISSLNLSKRLIKNALTI